MRSLLCAIALACLMVAGCQEEVDAGGYTQSPGAGIVATVPVTVPVQASVTIPFQLSIVPQVSVQAVQAAPAVAPAVTPAVTAVQTLTPVTTLRWGIFKRRLVPRTRYHLSAPVMYQSVVPQLIVTPK